MRKFSTLTLHVGIAVLLMGAAAMAQSNTSTPPSAAKSSTGMQAQSPASPPPAAIPGLPTEKDRVSYAIGMNVGTGLKRDSIEVDPQLIMKGLQDALAGGKLMMDDDQVKATMVQLQAEVRQREEAKRKQAAVDNQKAGDIFLAQNKTKPGVVTLPSGLQYKILKEGTGPKPTINDVVEVNYRGTHLDGKEFDSSYERGEPATLPIRGIIKGWTEALQLVPVGTKFQLFLPPDLAYGEAGAGRDIGPNETLIFDVDLLAIKDTSKAPAQPPAPPAAPASKK